VFTILTLGHSFPSLAQNVAYGYASVDIQTQTGALVNLGLDRIDQAALPLDGMYKYKQTGKGVTVFVLDSGIRLTHQEFEGRATCGLDVVLGQESLIPCEDKKGHGTHVAGIVAGKNVGVAKNANLVMVKVGIDGDDVDLSAVIAGLNYVQKQKLANPGKPMIASVSVGGPKLAALDDAARALVKAGVTVVVAAGNNGTDACGFSPGNVEEVITVGCSDRDDIVQDWSNFGSCVDIYAPGDGILSAGRKNDTRYVEGTGTSQSAPFVAGVAALYLQMKPSLSPNDVWQAIQKDSLKKVLTGGPITNETVLFDNTTNITKFVKVISNRLLYTGVLTAKECEYTGWRAYYCSVWRWMS
jgi:subtilisin family serine protease